MFSQFQFKDIPNKSTAVPTETELFLHTGLDSWQMQAG